MYVCKKIYIYIYIILYYITYIYIYTRILCMSQLCCDDEELKGIDCQEGPTTAEDVSEKIEVHQPTELTYVMRAI